MAGERHGHGMLCVNRPLLVVHLSSIGTPLLAILTAQSYIKQIIKGQMIWQHVGLCLSSKTAQTSMAGGLDRLAMLHRCTDESCHQAQCNRLRRRILVHKTSKGFFFSPPIAYSTTQSLRNSTIERRFGICDSNFPSNA